MKVYHRNFDWRRFSSGPKLDDAGEQREKNYELGGRRKDDDD